MSCYPSAPFTGGETGAQRQPGPVMAAACASTSRGALCVPLIIPVRQLRLIGGKCPGPCNWGMVMRGLRPRSIVTLKPVQLCRLVTANSRSRIHLHSLQGCTLITRFLADGVEPGAASFLGSWQACSEHLGSASSLLSGPSQCLGPSCPQLPYAFNTGCDAALTGWWPPGGAECLPQVQCPQAQAGEFRSWGGRKIPTPGPASLSLRSSVLCTERGGRTPFVV